MLELGKRGPKPKPLELKHKRIDITLSPIGIKALKVLRSGLFSNVPTSRLLEVSLLLVYRAVIQSVEGWINSEPQLRQTIKDHDLFQAVVSGLIGEVDKELEKFGLKFPKEFKTLEQLSLFKRMEAEK